MNKGRTAPCGVGLVIIDAALELLFCKDVGFPKAEPWDIGILGIGGAFELFFLSELRPKFRLEEKVK